MLLAVGNCARVTSPALIASRAAHEQNQLKCFSASQNSILKRQIMRRGPNNARLRMRNVEGLD
jgi:hypothetical protein